MSTMRWATIPVILGMSFWALACQSTSQTAPAPAPQAAVAPPTTPSAPDNTFSGAVAHVDTASKLLSVKSSSDQKEFTVGPKTQVYTETSTHGALSTLNVGDLVVVEYEQHDGLAMATRIVRKAVAAGEKPAPAVERLEKMLNPDPNNPYKTE